MQGKHVEKGESAQEQFDKMTKTPVHQLVLTLGLPTTISMLVTMCIIWRILFYRPDKRSAAGSCRFAGNTGIYDLYGAGKSVWHRWKLGYIQGIR